MNILAMDTSTPRGSVALLCGDALVLDEIFPADRSHTSELYPILQRVKKLTGAVDMIAIGLGPGSYAGVRVSIASGLGLGIAWGAELIGIPSAAAIETAEAAYIAIGDARRESFYFTRVRGGECIEGPLLLDEQSLREKLAHHPEFPVFSPAPLPSFPQARIALPRASIVAARAAAGHSIIARGNLEPLYLRDPHITTPKPR